MRDPRSANQRFLARNADGVEGEILGYHRRLTDPTATGTLWSMPGQIDTVWYFGGVELQRIDDGTFEEMDRPSRTVTVISR
ncbi:hypothetical protein [Sphingobium yanoikuyae]|uniref:hypothetical protein n=1 Tax=Sphingobium yanoikuyae TaxID=13690 RepID=UPI0028ABB614|nr:hypothetical protein [Sphingobium yanoikuyae]